MAIPVVVGLLEVAVAAVVATDEGASVAGLDLKPEVQASLAVLEHFVDPATAFVASAAVAVSAAVVVVAATVAAVAFAAVAFAVAFAAAVFAVVVSVAVAACADRKSVV